MPSKAKTQDYLDEAKTFSSDFDTYFNGGGRDGQSVHSIIQDNRRRYQMILKDAPEREKRNLSKLSSTKSTVAVDGVVEDALMEYHADPEAISFTAKLFGDIERDSKAKWLTEDFKYRCSTTFPFITWHDASLTAGICDGLEAAMVSWRKDSYIEKVDKSTYFYLGDNGVEQVTADLYQAGKQIYPDKFYEKKEIVEEEVSVYDSFWIDQLNPGVNLKWDFKAPLLNLDLGSVCLVILDKNLDELIQYCKLGVFDAITVAELEKMHGSSNEEVAVDNDKTVADPKQYTLDSVTDIKLWAFFKKVDCQWHVVFSIKGEKELSTLRKVNEVYFRGRRVNKLPVVMGTYKLKLWENVGRGMPELLAPLEDEWIDHRNNINDAAKRAIQGRYRLEPTSRLKIDDLINNVVHRASKGEYEKVEDDFSVLTQLRVAETIQADMLEVVPANSNNPLVVPRNSTKTLGATQLAMGQQNKKLSVQLMIRNETFFKPLLRLIVELIFAFETDDTILRVAAQKAGYVAPQVGNLIDFRQLDLDVDITINAGMGMMPREQKAQLGMQVFDWGVAHGIQQDSMKMYRTLSTLAGFEADQFVSKVPVVAEPPKTETTLAIKADWLQLPVEIQSVLTQNLMAASGGDTKAKITAQLAEEQHNGTTQPTRTGVPDMTQGEAAENQSIGGQSGR